MTTLSTGAADARTAMFAITTERCPQILCRLLGLVAQQDRLVERFEVESSARRYRVSLSIPDIDRHRAEIMLEKMRSIVSVRTARMRLMPEPRQRV